MAHHVQLTMHGGAAQAAPNLALPQGGSPAGWCACEGGTSCAHEDPTKQQGPNAIPGVHSSWVEGRTLLAMARPAQQAIRGVVQAFRKENVGLLLNLQEVGEHAECGPGVLPQSGLSYDPEDVMAAGVHVYAFGWPDGGVPELDRMMDIVQAMEHVAVGEGRRVAVHGHAGVGRTAMALACYLVYRREGSARQAVERVRRDRPRALRDARQAAYVHVFEQYCTHLRCLFASTLPLPLTAPSSPSGLGPSAISVDARSPAQHLPGAASHGGGGGGSGAAGGARQAAGGRASAAGAPVQPPEHRQATETHACGLVVVRGVRLPGRTPAARAGGGNDGDGAAAAVAPAVAQHAPGGNDDAAAAAKPWPALVPPTGPPQAPQPPAAPSQQHDGALTPADLGLEPPAPWALDFTPPALSLHAHHHAGDWQPKAPATYQAAMHRQRRLQHGRARRAFLHLHRFVGEAVLHIIAAARQHGAATAGRPAAAVAAPAPAPAALTQGFAAPAAAAELVRGEVQVVASVAVPAANWLSTQSMATGPQRPRHHQQQQPLPHYAAPRSMARPRPQAAPQQDRLQQRPSQQQQQLQQRPSQQQQQQQLQQRPSLDGGGGGGAALASRASLPDTPVVLLAPPPLPRGAPPPSALQPRDSGGASPTAARHLATTAGGRSFAASSSLKRASDEGGGEAAAGSIRASYTGDAVATVHGRRGSEVGEKLPLQLERRRSKPLGSRDSAAADAAGAVAVPPGVVLSPRAIAEGAESFGTPASKGLPHRQQQQQQQQHVQPRQRGAYITNLAAAAPRSTSQHLSTTLLHPPVPAPPLLAPPPAAIHGAAPPPPHGAEPHAARSTASSSGGGSSASAWPRRPQRRVHPTAPPAPPAPPTTTRPAPPPPPATTITCTARRHAPPAVTSASCFADALLRCADPAAREPLLESLAKDPLYARFALPAAPDDQPPPRPSDDGAPSPPPLTPITSRGPLGSLPTVAAHAQTLQAEADAGEFGGLGAAPVAAVVLALEHLMGRLTATAPAVSDATLRCARDHYEDLPFHQAADTGEAARLLGGLPADDQELLLLFSALLRHAAVASGGPGCEEHVKGLVGWVLRLLLGPQAERPGALASQEAMACLLWYLVRNDAAFAALVVARQQRVGGDGAGAGGGAEAALAVRPHREEAVSVSSAGDDPYALAGWDLPVPRVLQPSLGGAADGSMMQRGGGLPAALAAHSGKAAPQQRHLVAAAGGSGPRATAGGRQAIEWVPGGHLPPRAPSAAGEAPGRHSHGTAGEQQEEQEQEQEQEERRRQATHNGCMSETTALTEQQLWPHDVWV